MAFELAPLPFADDALEPHVSKETIAFHYGKHHQAYVNKLNGMLAGSGFENHDLNQIVMQADGGIFNNAAQIWNHNFYWQSLAPAGQTISSRTRELLEQNFGCVDNFKKAFTEKALSLFGSGWTWLVQHENGKLSIVNTTNADTPLRDNLTPLLTCDVWEHAYYIDTRNARPTYLQNFWEIVNWNCIDKHLKTA